ncbi:hypothetical protein ABZ714_11175 [Streptomyces sp. NPDC006798]|uniref:hypothetical protein n=1 Tax=Streptomyces sp. NPDC006798 TaxID=3155462 RepID=UPI0033ED584E
MAGQPVTRSLGERIEALYGQPLADLHAHADQRSGGNLLAALLTTLTDLDLADRRIAFEQARLRLLAHPERELDRADTGHIADCARRLAESVAVRDAHVQSLTAVLDSLHRTPAAEAPPAVPAPPPSPAPAPAR